MWTRLFQKAPWLSSVLAAAGVALSGCTATAHECPAEARHRDWAKAPALVSLDTEADVWALGDVHGDLERMMALLSAHGLARAGATPGDATWTGGNAVLVCTGDVIDKGPRSVDTLVTLRALTASAAKAGGRVILTLGNHEAEFLSGRTEDLTSELQARHIAPREVLCGTDAEGLGAFLRGLPFAARVNDGFYSHAGNTHGQTLEALASGLRSGVDARGFNAPVLLDADSLLEARLNPAPWWEGGPQSSEATLADWASKLGVHHFVLGHRPTQVGFADGSERPSGKLFQKYGRVFLIDVGMSRGVGESQGALLHFKRAAGRTSAFTALPDGTETPLWQQP